MAWDDSLKVRLAEELKHALPPLSSEGSSSLLSREEEELSAAIRRDTAMLNRNNVTRTAAYWTMFRQFPELHWAFLAHIVSRNGGWSMTDLKGQWLPELLNRRLAESIFSLLEACNALIFQDAYPQLRLYAESRRTGRNLFGLLPGFGVSSFMGPFWSLFLSDGNPLPITEALIVNEQHYIQSRVVAAPEYRHSVLDSVAFRSQPLLQTNQLIVPLWCGGAANGAIPMRLAGRVLESFADLNERIAFGKALYGMLFGYPKILRASTAFARHVPHTGSRADYWPQRYSSRLNAKDGDSANAGIAVQGKWYSPLLSDAWPDHAPLAVSKGDWFNSLSALSYTGPISLPRVIDMTHEHLFGQYKLQAAVLLERSFMNGASSRRTGLG
ncbi:DUF2515 family protein [Cohnella boryungensis]|uniref:DUF2515 family protein n=1 Tax=Cohnella boryungensis TaxID=768479 RepID=A0ABV8S8G4_9BACL